MVLPSLVRIQLIPFFFLILKINIKNNNKKSLKDIIKIFESFFYSINFFKLTKNFKQILKKVQKVYNYNINIFVYIYYKNFFKFFLIFFNKVNSSKILFLSDNNKNLNFLDVNILNFLTSSKSKFFYKLFHYKIFLKKIFESFFFLNKFYRFFFFFSLNNFFLRRVSNDFFSTRFISVIDTNSKDNKFFLSLPVLINFELSTSFYFFYIFLLLKK